VILAGQVFDALSCEQQGAPAGTHVHDAMMSTAALQC
jgi:hypothetical protein